MEHFPKLSPEQEESAYAMGMLLGNKAPRYALKILSAWIDAFTQSDEIKNNEVAMGMTTLIAITDLKPGNEGGTHSSLGISQGYPDVLMYSMHELANDGEGMMKEIITKLHLVGTLSSMDVITEQLRKQKNNEHENVSG